MLDKFKAVCRTSNGDAAFVAFPILKLAPMIPIWRRRRLCLHLNGLISRRLHNPEIDVTDRLLAFLVVSWSASAAAWRRSFVNSSSGSMITGWTPLSGQTDRPTGGLRQWMRRATTTATTEHAPRSAAVAAIAFEGRFVDRTRSSGHSESWDDSQFKIR